MSNPHQLFLHCLQPTLLSTYDEQEAHPSGIPGTILATTTLVAPGDASELLRCQILLDSVHDSTTVSSTCKFQLRKYRECKQFRCPDLFRRMVHYHESNFPVPRATSQQTWQDIVGQRQAAFRPLWAALEKTKDGSNGWQIHTWPGRGIIGYD